MNPHYVIHLTLQSKNLSGSFHTRNKSPCEFMCPKYALNIKYIVH